VKLGMDSEVGVAEAAVAGQEEATTMAEVVHFFTALTSSGLKLFYLVRSPLSSTWPHLNSDVGLEKGEY